MDILICPDKFKDSLSAEAACEIIEAKIQRLRPGCHTRLLPLTDGGDGFAQVLTAAAAGVLRSVTVSDPLGRPHKAAFGLVPLQNIAPQARARLQLPDDLPPSAPIAIVEMAAASGLQWLRLDERDPWHTHSTGTGELIRAAATAGAAAIVLGIGGSATHDLGLGALTALGHAFEGAKGQCRAPLCPANWQPITHICGSLPPRLPPLRIACDVTNPLLGAQGAASVYAPQKGLRPADLPRLEAETTRMATLLCAHHQRDFDTLCRRPGTGAAGGIAFGLICAAGDARAMLIPGFDLVADWLQLHHHLPAADIVITGEGRFDASSLAGKGPGSLVKTALSLGKTVHVFAGSIDCPPAERLHLHSITPEGMPLEQALSRAPELLRRAVAKAFSTS